MTTCENDPERERRSCATLSPWATAAAARPQGPSSPGPTAAALGNWCMLASSLFFSLMWLVVKVFLPDVHTIVIVFGRSLMQGSLALGCKVLTGDGKESLLGPRRLWPLMVARGLFAWVALTAVLFTVQLLPLPTAVTVHAMVPLFGAALAAALLGERWLRADIAAFAVCFAGVLLIVRPAWLFGPSPEDGSDDDDDVEAASASTAAAAGRAWAISVGLLSAAAEGAAHVTARRIGEGASSFTMIVWYDLVSLALGAPALQVMVGSWNVFEWGGWRNFGAVMAVGVMGFLGQYFAIRSLQLARVATVTLIKNMQVVFAYLFEFLLVHEPLHLWGTVGSAVVAVSLVFNAAFKACVDGSDGMTYGSLADDTHGPPRQDDEELNRTEDVELNRTEDAELNRTEDVELTRTEAGQRLQQQEGEPAAAAAGDGGDGAEEGRRDGGEASTEAA